MGMSGRIGAASTWGLSPGECERSLPRCITGSCQPALLEVLESPRGGISPAIIMGLLAESTSQILCLQPCGLFFGGPCLFLPIRSSLSIVHGRLKPRGSEPRTHQPLNLLISCSYPARNDDSMFQLGQPVRFEHRLCLHHGPGN